MRKMQSCKVDFLHSKRIFSYFVAVAEVNPTHEVCKIATVLISNVAKGVAEVHNFVHMTKDLVVLILRQAGNLDLRSSTASFGQRWM